MKKLIFTLPLLALLAVGCAKPQLSNSQGAMQNRKQAVSPATTYDLTSPDGAGKTLDISLNGAIVKQLSVNDLPPPYNAVVPNRTDYAFDLVNTSDKASLDMTRNKIYFFALNRATIKNSNADTAIFSYDFSTDKISLITDRGFMSGGDPTTLSPNDHYLVFRQGIHGGVCANIMGLAVFDLIDNKDKAQLPEAPAEGEQDGMLIFNKWIDNKHFSYTSYFFDSSDQCQAAQGDETKAPAEQKILELPTDVVNMIGGQRDDHGCLIAAGYTWCGAKNSCIRPWEQYCTAASPTIAIFVCDDAKTITANFYPTDDKYVDLVLSDGRKMTIPHAVSADGARYAKSDDSFVFWNIGDTAFVTEGNKTTYSNCATNK
jgi:membrane-bound inhibitor of C-type lysozyme